MTSPTSAIREEALKRLHTRAARLVRLLGLEAPSQILINEVQLLADAARMLDPAAWAQGETRHWLATHKPRLGFCAEPDCEERIKDGYDVCEPHIDDEEIEDESEEEYRVRLQLALADPALSDIEREHARSELAALDDN